MKKIMLYSCSMFFFLNCTENIKTNTYLISTGSIDIERLTILNNLYNKKSLDALRLESGMKVLTLGCGIGLLEIEIAKKIGLQGQVLATDISQLQIEIAQKNKNLEKISNLTFKELDISKIDQINETFDRIHCRFVLSHMPWDSIEKLLPMLLSKLNSNGALVIEEITTLDSLKCEPFSEEYELWRSYVNKQWKAQSADSAPGKRLYEYLKKLNYEMLYNTYQPVLKEANEKRILSLGIRSIAKGLIEKGLANYDDISCAINKLKSLEDNPNIFPTYCEISQFYIKKLMR